jgi:hypothetical protein
VQFENSADRVVLRLADGRELEADILIGADGIDSVVRAQLHGATEPRAGGFVCWLALAPFRHPFLGEGESVHFWGRGMRVGIHDIGHGNTYWWATMSTVPDLAANWPHGKTDVLRRFRGWSPEISEIISATAECDILALPAQDRPPLPWWGRGRVTLLGDAAHSMLPSLGQGANAAIEDAVVLAHALAVHRDADTALRAYEQQRIGRTTALVEGSRLLGRVEQAANRAAVAVRNRFIRHASEKQLVDALIKPMTWPGFGDSRRFAALPRRLSPLERWHWTVDQVAPLHIVSRVRISGWIDVAAVRAALDALAHRHPVLRAAICSVGGAYPQFVPAPPRPISLRVVPKGSWLSEIDHELRDRFDPEGPLLRATLITVEPDVHDLLLTSTYSIADCVTVISFARQVLELAADATHGWVPEISMPSGAEDLIPEGFRGARGKGRALARLIADAARDRRAAPMRLAREAWVPPEERFTRLVHRSISGTEYRALLMAWRARRILPEAVVGAALAMAAGADAGAVQANIGVAVSVPFRDHLAEPIDDDTAGGFQAMTSIPVAHVPGESLWQAAEPFNAELRDGIRRRHHLAALSAVPLLIPKTPANADTVVKLLDSRGPGNLCLTYLDVADFPVHIDEWTLSGAQFVSGTSITGYAMLTAVSGHDALELNLGYTDGIISPDRAETLIENTAAALRKAAAEAIPTLQVC